MKINVYKWIYFKRQSCLKQFRREVHIFHLQLSSSEIGLDGGDVWASLTSSSQTFLCGLWPNVVKEEARFGFGMFGKLTIYIENWCTDFRGHSLLVWWSLHCFYDSSIMLICIFRMLCLKNVDLPSIPAISHFRNECQTLYSHNPKL